jgi:hypothetical protein
MNGNEEVGKISYSVVIDVSALKAGTKSAEQAIKTSFNSSERTLSGATRRMDNSIAGTVAQLAVLTASLVALRQIGNFLGESISSANRFQAAMLGLDSVAGAFTGESEKALEAAKQLSSDGLLPLADAATGLKNLLAAGYGLEDATLLMTRFKDSAAFARQGSLSFGEAVRSATEGIKNGNSILVDNAGVTKNLSVILQEAGYSAQDLQKASSDVGVRMAILNGIVRETNAQVGDAAKLTQTAAGADAQLSYSTEQLQVRLGDLANVLRRDAVTSLARFISANQDAIIAFGSGAAGAIAFAGGAYALGKAFKALIPLMNLVARHPVVAILTVTAGLISSLVVGNLLDGLSEGFESSADGADQLAGSMSSVSDATSKLQKDLAKINRDYLESLTEVVRRHQQSVKDLTTQVNDEQANYRAAVQKRIAAFEEEQGKEESLHQDKVDNLQNQIDFLRKYNNASNRQQLSELQFALAKENSEYEKRNVERKTKYDADAEAERLSNQQRVSDLQARLTEERAFLSKHAKDVRAVRDVILLDEIQRLKRSRDEQIQAARETSKGIGDSYSQLGKALKVNMKDIGDAAGKQMGDSFIKALKDAIKKSFSQVFETIAKGLAEAQKSLVKALGGSDEDAKNVLKSTLASPTFLGRPMFAEGGYTGRGAKNDVAGTVHAGEYVLPKSMVNQATGLPKPEAVGAFGGNGGNTYQITLQVSGAIVTSAQDERRLAEVIGRRLNELMQQKGYKPAVEGI